MVSVSTEYERAKNFNTDYLLAKTEEHFEKKNLAKLTRDMKTELSGGNILEAQQRMVDYKRIALPQSKGIDPFTDRDSMRSAFEKSAEPIFKLPGAAGNFLNDLFVRDAFVTLLGPEKRGKTWLLIELSIWARRSGLNVAFFAAGDMTLPQMQIRYGVRFTARSHKPKYCGSILVPTLDCWYNQDGSCELAQRTGDKSIIKDIESKELFTYEEAKGHLPCTYCLRNKDSGDYRGAAWQRLRPPVKPLEWGQAADRGEKLARQWGKKSRFKLSAYANGTLSVSEMKRQLHRWYDEDGFVADVVISDYMDLKIPSSNSRQDGFRHQTNEIWAESRGLSQEMHCLLLSASQSDADSFYAKYIGMKNFSEDKRKFSHVTGTITMNQLPEEKKRGIMRLGTLAVREDEFDERRSVTILQSLASGRPLLASF